MIKAFKALLFAISCVGAMSACIGFAAFVRIAWFTAQYIASLDVNIMEPVPSLVGIMLAAFVSGAGMMAISASALEEIKP